MRRCLILFLILLLPVQVFAGMVEYRSASAHTHATSSTQTAHAAPTMFTASTGQIPSAIDYNYDDLVESIASHAALGDEAILPNFLIFAFVAPAFAYLPRNDAAPIAPYLPPAARPPQA